MKTTKRRKPTAAQKAAAAKKRAYLIQLTKQVRAAMEMGRFPDCERVNEAIMQVYQEQTGQEDFSTFAGWKKEGYRVRKGEKSFLIWGRPRKGKTTHEAIPEKGIEESEEKYKFFPVCYLFHRGQVEEAKPRQDEAQPMRKVSDLEEGEQPKDGELLLIA